MDDDLGANSDLSDNTLDLAALTLPGGTNGKGANTAGSLSGSSRWADIFVINSSHRYIIRYDF